MLDIRKIMSNTEGEIFRLINKGVSEDELYECFSLYRKKNDLLQEVEKLRFQKNDISKKTASKKEIKKNGVINEVKRLNKIISETEQQLNAITSVFETTVLNFPNIPDADVPIGKDENENIEIDRWGNIPDNLNSLPHWDIAEKLDLIDFKRGSKVSGARFVYYKGDGARLERALWNFMLDEHVNAGYEEMIPPYIVNDEAMVNTGNFPKFEEDAFRLIEEKKSLIPTAEVPLTNYFTDEIINANELPINLAALSPAFRKEAGSAGRDTRGIIRLHQFNKVELVKFTNPKESMTELENMTRQAESILKKLGLPYRKVLLCTGDIGFSSAKTYDLEVWMAASKEYREISSCSNCTDFQARRAKIRYKDKYEKGLVHTLNGSGLAIGRTVAAILEFYCNEDGTVNVPQVLIPYMGKEIMGECDN